MTRRRKYTFALVGFTLCQLIGSVVPFFTNIHNNIWPLFALLFLIPGIAVGLVFPMSLALGVAVAVPVNALVWWLAARWWADNEAVE